MYCSSFSEVHVAAPAGTDTYCGQAVNICRTDNPCICAGGVIVDRSNHGWWEAGPGVFSALSQTANESHCGGFGEVSVFIKTL
jgi:hypothetical protein